MSDSSDEQAVRVGVFVDWQNCYRTARDAFGLTAHGGISGNVKPLAMAKLLAARGSGASARRVLAFARIYAGRASQHRDQRTYNANQRQFAAWQAAGPEVVVVARTLDYSLSRPREKGIDVALAIDVVRYVLVKEDADIAIVVSADTDLLPAVELIASEVGPGAVEVATWDGPYWSPSPLAIDGKRLTTHKMDRPFYDRIADPTDYAQPRPRPGQGTQGRRLPPGR